MKIFVCNTGGCACHPEGLLMTLAYGRGHAVKLMNKQLEEGGYGALPRDEKHVVHELDPEAHKKGYVNVSFLPPWSDE